MIYSQKIATQLQVKPEQVTATVELLDAENTVPFIARYRKEQTGGLDEEQIRQVDELVGKLRALDDRRATVITSIQEQGKLDPDLHQKLLAAETMTVLEDLYQPYKPKRRTRAMIAREKGLQGLADWIIKQPVTRQSLGQIAQPFLNEQVPTDEEAWIGARDIVAEMISDHAEVRRVTREKALLWATLRCMKIEAALDERGVYQVYHEFNLGVNRLRPHQVLAINRGEAEKILRVKLDIPERDWRNAIWVAFRPDRNSVLAEQMDLVINDAAEPCCCRQSSAMSGAS